jgi:hypothetical protein
MAANETTMYSQIPEFDLFLYGRPNKGYTCYLCPFGDMIDQAFTAESVEEMELHLKAHLNVGHKIPGDIFERILNDSEVMYGPQA